ncbi:MAG: dTDP-4-dehydrorhamnose reductase [Natronospirillum sp.]|uniref:dTDP-4-dehydrorhamnose reductase n=1 Tax=Natronospirillum sp. TaxID=2812955 RepID=UPI0025DB3BFF|nr:dTDP-4-dehydrorhamnose reductase [Natronospirillum sp.]MCH8551936.1 dTDP-4-dehydrorhamnose reductase [Natronospirillum sp.]
MRVLITGAGGQVGRALMRVLTEAGLVPVGLTRAQLDITDAGAVAAVLAQEKPDYVINAAAFSDVAVAQGDATRCYAINRDGAAVLARACAEQGAAFFYLSTDYVFDGMQPQPYAETDKPNPRNVYGNSKYEGEEAVREYCPRHLILRTSWVFSEEGNNFFVRTLERAVAGQPIKGVNDQISCPTWAGHLALVVIAMLRQVDCNTDPELWGTYHYCDRGATTRYDFARTIVSQAVQAGMASEIQVTPIESSELQNRAEEARQSVLATDHLFFTFGIRQRGWRQGIKAALRKIQQRESAVQSN